MATSSGRKTNSWFVRKLILINYSIGGGYGVEGNNKIQNSKSFWRIKL
jgi:hypothetical protein